MPSTQTSTATLENPSENSQNPTENPSLNGQTAAPNPEVHPDDAAPEHDEEFSPAFLFLEDFVLSELLRVGRPLSSDELRARAQDWTIPTEELRLALLKSRVVREENDAWDCVWRLAFKGLSREERSRQPLEALLRDLLRKVGKPLPAKVLAREVSLMRNLPDPNLETATSHVLRTSLWALELAPDVFLHGDFVFKIGAPNEELLIRENGLHHDLDFQGLMQFAQIEATTPQSIARELMEFTGGPLNQKVIGFFVYRAQPNGFSSEKLAAQLNDRTVFQPLKDGFIALQDQIGALKSLTQEFLEEFGEPKPEIAAPILEETAEIEAQTEETPAEEIEEAAPEIAPAWTPSEALLEHLESRARADETAHSVALREALSEFGVSADELETALEGTAQFLAAHPLWLQTRAGIWTLRETLPAGVGTVPDALALVFADYLNPATDEPFDFELEDDALAPELAAWIHDPKCEDVLEKHEISAPVAADPSSKTAKFAVLNHHFRAHTLPFRAVDAAAFGLAAADAPIVAPVSIHDSAEDETHEAFVSRETGLVYGLGQWIEENLPPSGGVVEIETRSEGGLEISYAGPDPLTFLTERRIAEIEQLLDVAPQMSLFELLCELLSLSKAGMETQTLHASVNVLRRTTKRQVASLLCGYGCFESRQRNGNLVWSLATSLEEAAATKKASFSAS